MFKTVFRVRNENVWYLFIFYMKNLMFVLKKDIRAGENVRCISKYESLCVHLHGFDISFLNIKRII